ncbi:hypothetical protein ASF61_18195 [Duganella sp. Leaf126]|nr:hypothetical protein ASF61_18195 [Duganella sp. Leaf126]
MRGAKWLALGWLGSMMAAGAQAALGPSQLALVVNDNEPNSVALAALYREAHQVPEKNLIHVRLDPRARKLSPEEFAPVREQILGQLAPGIRAVLMVWTVPYAVGCNAITAALTLGYDADQCSAPCGPGKASAYYGDTGAALPAAAAMRISMLLPTTSLDLGKDLIARGTARNFRLPQASAYYLTTSDTARSARARLFPPSGRIKSHELTIRNMHADVLEGASDIMVYQTGMVRVDKLETLKFLPGALADHLTSTGGDLLGTNQMSSLRWLEAGATASYGTVSEPCNYWQKFPQPAVLLKRYLSGDSAIEAYWHSVAWPAQGLFIGDPLAAPYAR